jgi:hypothetical protein
MSHNNPFSHYIITRFNLKREEWKLSRDKKPVLTDLWLKNRFELFENYCFPCVAGQTIKNFTWLVFFDTDTPGVYKERIVKLQEKCEQFTPVFVDNMVDFLPGIDKAMNKESSPYIITSRLDNDDCISTDYIETVQSYFNAQEYLALDFPTGYTLKIHPAYQLGYKIQAYNPFNSLIEKNTNPQTVWKKEHREWKKETRLKRVMDKKIWMSIIHQENKVNDFTGFGNIDASILSKFSINETLKSTMQDELIPYSTWRFQAFRNKIDSYFKLYSKDVKKKLKFY